MTRNQSIKVIKEELKRLNERIDLKIIHGQPYASESKMHKMFLERIQKMRRRNHTGFLGKLSAVFSLL